MAQQSFMAVIGMWDAYDFRLGCRAQTQAQIQTLYQRSPNNAAELPLCRRGMVPGNPFPFFCRFCVFAAKWIQSRCSACWKDRSSTWPFHLVSLRFHRRNLSIRRRDRRASSVQEVSQQDAVVHIIAAAQQIALGNLSGLRIIVYIRNQQESGCAEEPSALVI
jgi:hypothetical protein